MCRDGMRVREFRKEGGRGIRADVEVKDSRRSTRGQLVGGTVKV